MYNKTTKGISVIQCRISIAAQRLVALLFICLMLLSTEKTHSQAALPYSQGKEYTLHASNNPEQKKKNKNESIVKISAHKECVFAKYEDLQEHGNMMRILEEERIISHTPPDAGKSKSDSDYLTIDAHLSNFNNTMVLFVKITIQTENPRPIYGSIFKDDKLLLKLDNGETVALRSGTSDIGSIDQTKKQAIFTTNFLIEDELLEPLLRSEVTKARLYWSKGYEDYAFVNSDFFIRQIGCVK